MQESEGTPTEGGRRVRFDAVAVTTVVLLLVVSTLSVPVGADARTEIDFEVAGEGPAAVLNTQYERVGVRFGDSVVYRDRFTAPRVGVTPCPSEACATARSGTRVVRPLDEDLDGTARVVFEFAEPQEEVGLFVGLPPEETTPRGVELLGYDAKGALVDRDVVRVSPPTRTVTRVAPSGDAASTTTEDSDGRTATSTGDSAVPQFGADDVRLRDPTTVPVVFSPSERPAVNVSGAVGPLPPLADDAVTPRFEVLPEQVEVTYQTVWTDASLTAPENAITRVEIAVVEEGAYVPFLVDDLRFGADSPPVAAVTADPIRVTEGAPVTFDARASTDDVAVSQYLWDFENDGSFVAGSSVVSHVFDDPGPHRVALRVVDGSGQFDEAVADVSVNGVPDAFVDANRTVVTAGDTVAFDGRESTDDRGIVRYLWTIRGESSAETAAGPQTTYTFDDPGRYVVVLTVFDADGARNDARLAFDVAESPTVRGDQTAPTSAVDPSDENAAPPTGGRETSEERSAPEEPDESEGRQESEEPPEPEDSEPTTPTPSQPSETERFEADFRWEPTTPVVSRLVQFDASASTIPPGRTPTYRWTFEDGRTASGEAVERTFSTDDPQTVTLEVTLDGEESSTASLVVRPTFGEPPVAAFDPSADESVPLGRSVTFDGGASRDADGDVVSYVWTFGSDDRTESGQTVSRTFEEGSEATVTLTVTDDVGLTNSVTKTYTLVSTPETLPPVPPELLGLAFVGTAAVLAYGGVAGGFFSPPGSLSSLGVGRGRRVPEGRHEADDDGRRRASPTLRIARIVPSGGDVAGELVELHNPGRTAVSLDGVVVEGADVVYEFGDDERIEPGERLTLYTGPGTDAEDGSVRYGGRLASALDTGLSRVTTRRGDELLAHRTYLGSAGRTRHLFGRR
ncbi:PKD domain-containing protein [Halogeometricum limi]|uniref:PKD domain-containing protein n=1 Tax=Halogeometricum limi TaxID=555875 RepID=A0A1I6ID21_9EURY|nr:PKD domain-containing protein [Halogeometricum limi]SFR64593.1 PKD domain-containing protein [Halogeometricum limi]